jgi:hypothetical protein
LGANQLHYRTMLELGARLPHLCVRYPLARQPNTKKKREKVGCLLRRQRMCRHRRDLNSRGQSPLAFKTNSLTTRTRCLPRGMQPLSSAQEKNFRHRRDLNSRGQSPVDFESTSLTTRTRCLGHDTHRPGRTRTGELHAKKQKSGCIANPSFDLGTFRL